MTDVLRSCGDAAQAGLQRSPNVAYTRTTTTRGKPQKEGMWTTGRDGPADRTNKPQRLTTESNLMYI